jgi:hypothetical protein
MLAVRASALRNERQFLKQALAFLRGRLDSELLLAIKEIGRKQSGCMTVQVRLMLLVYLSTARICAALAKCSSSKET